MNLFSIISIVVTLLVGLVVSTPTPILMTGQDNLLHPVSRAVNLRQTNREAVISRAAIKGKRRLGVRQQPSGYPAGTCGSTVGGTNLYAVLSATSFYNTGGLEPYVTTQPSSAACSALCQSKPECGVTFYREANGGCFLYKGLNNKFYPQADATTQIKGLTCAQAISTFGVVGTSYTCCQQYV